MFDANHAFFFRFVHVVFLSSFRAHPSAPLTHRVAAKYNMLPLRYPIVGQDGKYITSILSPPDKYIYPIRATHPRSHLDTLHRP